MRNTRGKWLLRIACLMLVFVLAAVLLLPPTPFIVAGYFRGEAFFEGKPTSYWRMQVQERLQPSPRGTLEALLARFGYKRGSPETIAGPSRIATAPVLLELLADPDPRVRLFAAKNLCYHEEHQRASASALGELVYSPDSDVRCEAALALAAISPRADEPISRLIQVVKQEEVSEFALSCALEALGRTGARRALPVLTPLLQHPNDSVRIQAAKAIWLIDPHAAAAMNVFVDALNAGGEQRAIAVSLLGNATPVWHAGQRVLERLSAADLADEERVRLTRALKEIDPQAARDAGIK